MALISVVIPVFNGELTIEDTVKSVLNQTYANLEIIVINDGSYDSTLDILERIKDPRLMIFSFPNSGLSASRNRGIEHAQGEFISFIDADDLWTSNKLESQLISLRKNPDAAVAYSWTTCIDKFGNLLEYGSYDTFTGYVFPDLLTNFFIGSGSNALIRRNVFDEVEWFDETLTSAEDWDLFLRLAARYKFTAIPSPQILYRLTDNSMSRNVTRQERESLKVIERAYSREPGSKFLQLKGKTYANLYIYLSAHALRGTPDRREGFIATRFLLRSIKNDPLILKRAKLIAILVFKIITVFVLPPQQARTFRNNLKALMGGIPKNAMKI